MVDVDVDVVDLVVVVVVVVVCATYDASGGHGVLWLVGSADWRGRDEFGGRRASNTQFHQRHQSPSPKATPPKPTKNTNRPTKNDPTKREKKKTTKKTATRKKHTHTHTHARTHAPFILKSFNDILVRTVMSIFG